MCRRGNRILGVPERLSVPKGYSVPKGVMLPNYYLAGKKIVDRLSAI